MKTKKKPAVKKYLTHVDGRTQIRTASYARDLQAEVNKTLDRMEAEWGFRPPVTVKIESTLRVSADFNLKGFAHKGGGKTVKAGTVGGRNSPRNVARDLLGEIVAHRNTCRECGTGTIPLHSRVYTLRSLLGLSQYSYDVVSLPTGEFTEHKNFRTGVVDRYPKTRQAYPKQNPRDREQFEALYCVPADGVERSLFPSVAKKLDTLIEAWNKNQTSFPRAIPFRDVPPGRTFFIANGGTPFLRLAVPVEINGIPNNVLCLNSKVLSVLEEDTLVYANTVDAESPV